MGTQQVGKRRAGMILWKLFVCKEGGDIFRPRNQQMLAVRYARSVSCNTAHGVVLQIAASPIGAHGDVLVFFSTIFQPDSFTIGVFSGDFNFSDPGGCMGVHVRVRACPFELGGLQGGDVFPALNPTWRNYLRTGAGGGRGRLRRGTISPGESFALKKGGDILGV